MQFFTGKAVRSWNRLFREAVNVSILPVPNRYLHNALCNQTSEPRGGEKIVLDVFQLKFAILFCSIPFCSLLVYSKWAFMTVSFIIISTNCTEQPLTSNRETKTFSTKQLIIALNVHTQPLVQSVLSMMVTGK